MNWARKELTKDDLSKMRKKSQYEIILDAYNAKAKRSAGDGDRPELRKLKHTSDLAKDFDEGRRGYVHKRFVSNPKWTWGAFNGLCEYVEAEDWTYFVTITSKWKFTPRSARKCVEHWLDLWKESQALYERSGGGKFVAFWVLEEHKSGGFHIHVLVKFPKSYMLAVPQKATFDGLRTSAQTAVGGKQWRNAKGTLGHWHRVDVKLLDQKMRTQYVTKYLTKGLADWDFYCILNGRREDWWNF